MKIKNIKNVQMKTKITAVIVLFLLSISASAQVDRSKQPKPGPAPKITLEKPGEFELKNGLKVLVVENHKLPRVSYSLTIDNKPIVEGDIAGVSSILGAMLGNGTTNISKDEFNEEIDFLGARLGFSSQSASASSLTKYSERILELMADAAINPLLTEEEFQKEKDKALENIKSSAKSSDVVAGRVGRALSFGVKHANGEFVTEETLQNITLKDVVSYYRRYFTPKNAYLVVVGDVDFRTVKKQIKKYFASWDTMVEVQTTVLPPKANVKYTQINFVDMPNAVQSNISLTNNVPLKMNDEDFFGAKIANYILGGGGEGYLFLNLREDKAYTYGSYSSLGTDKYGAARFNAFAKVRNTVTDSAVVEILKEVNRIKTETVSVKDLNNAKAKYVGSFVLALERPETIARYALNIKKNNLPEDFYTTYLKKVNAVTADDVKRAANKYFTSENARIVVVGKGSDVLENLEKTGIPIKYYDKYAKPVDKPVYSKPIPKGVTAQTVISDYIKAVGGEAKLKTVKTVLTNADVTIAGAPFSPKAIIKAMAPNKISMEMVAEGMGTLMKRKFDGANGYQEQMGRKVPMSEKELDKQKSTKGLFPELYYNESNISLESSTTIDGVDVYKIKVTEGEDVSYRYYSVENGLLVQSESTSEAQGQSMTTIENVSDYKSVDGIKFPYTQKITVGPQVITLQSTDVKINEGVTEEDFN